jgi:hypothetical protein
MTTRHRSAPPIQPTAYESRKTNLGNLEGYVRSAAQQLACPGADLT